MREQKSGSQLRMRGRLAVGCLTVLVLTNSVFAQNLSFDVERSFIPGRVSFELPERRLVSDLPQSDLALYRRLYEVSGARFVVRDILSPIVFIDWSNELARNGKNGDAQSIAALRSYSLQTFEQQAATEQDLWIEAAAQVYPSDILRRMTTLAGGEDNLVALYSSLGRLKAAHARGMAKTHFAAEDRVVRRQGGQDYTQELTAKDIELYPSFFAASPEIRKTLASPKSNLMYSMYPGANAAANAIRSTTAKEAASSKEIIEEISRFYERSELTAAKNMLSEEAQRLIKRQDIITPIARIYIEGNNGSSNQSPAAQLASIFNRETTLQWLTWPGLLRRYFSPYQINEVYRVEAAKARTP